MELVDWLPDGPAGWIVLAAVLVALGWWAARSLPGRLFGATSAQRLAKERGWLVKVSPTGPGGGSAWEAGTVPGTYLEFLGEHQGLVFHAREHRTRATRSSGHPGEQSYRWRPDYVVTVATTAPPGQGADRWLAAYPAILDWEQRIFHDLDRAMRPPPGGVHSGSGVVSVGKRDDRLSKKQLLADLDRLVALARSQQQ
ncbi:hypothetical protein [Prauserella flavalba]|uniref:Uncharacterized protein n=1 Tax=Prauserella flavalba TaxID=1477506 RepID=A0A318LTV6_9PSEU|nr:hypothetical protein [Prauserella flavalba]PXY37937.1 hypothetical protein BA062_04870 [Prauserella flavalba]